MEKCRIDTCVRASPARHTTAIKGEKIEDKLEKANSDESEKQSEVAESVRMFDSDTLNQPRPKRKKRQ